MRAEFTITVRFDNPQRLLGFIGRRRRTQSVRFNKPAIAAYLTGVRTPLDTHQIARELDGIRKDVHEIREKYVASRSLLRWLRFK